MLGRLAKLFSRGNELEKYENQISEAKRIINNFENKYKMSSEEFIAKRYTNTCLDVEAADANNWATLYLTVGKTVNDY